MLLMLNIFALIISRYFLKILNCLIKVIIPKTVSVNVYSIHSDSNICGNFLFCIL